MLFDDKFSDLLGCDFYRIIMKPVIVVLMILFLSACGSGGTRNDSRGVKDWNQDPRPLGKTLVYECLGGEFIARLGPGEMAVWVEDRYLILSQVRSDSGVRYTESEAFFQMTGDNIQLFIDDRNYTDCNLVPARGPWEDARRRGVDFRAVGNETGWYLELKQGGQLLFVGDYGASRSLFSTPEPNREGSKRVYHAHSGTADVKVEIIDEPCMDTMSGEDFSSRVTVLLGRKQYQGCGRELDYPWQ